VEKETILTTLIASAKIRMENQTEGSMWSL